MKVFLLTNFFWMATVSLSVLIGMGMAVGGGILLCIRDNLPSKLLSMNKNMEGFFVKINLRNKKK